MGTRVLTVEDDERIRASVRLALEDEGWTVDEAATGEDAVELFIANPADVVLIDIMLPGIDGFELCRRIRAKSSVPIVMVTARSDTHDVVAGLEAGADDFLTKPVRDLALFARVRSLLRVKLLLDELRLREETSRQMNILRDVVNRDELLHGKRVLFVGEDARESDLIASIFDENSHLDVFSETE